MSFHKTARGEIYYEVLGQGEPLLLLRGLGRSSRYWLGFEKELAHHFKVIVMDQRGLGRTSLNLQWSNSMQCLAQDCLQLMDALQIQRFHVFGLSLGGMIALELAALAANRLSSLLVANCSSRDYWAPRINPRALQALLIASLRGKFHEVLMEHLVAAKTFRDKKDEIGTLWKAILQEEGFPWLTIVKQLGLAMRFSIRGRIDAAGPPILLLSGSEDRFVAAANSRHLHRLIPSSSFQVLKGAGHEITLGFEREIIQIILDLTAPQDLEGKYSYEDQSQ